MKVGAVDDARNDFADVERLARVLGNDAVQFFGSVLRLLDRTHRHRRHFFAVQMRDDFTRDAKRMLVVLGQMIGHARGARMHIAAAQFFRGHHFAGGRFHQWRATQKNRALVFDDDRFIAHRRHIGAAGGAGTHHAGDLRNALR